MGIAAVSRGPPDHLDHHLGRPLAPLPALHGHCPPAHDPRTAAVNHARRSSAALSVLLPVSLLATLLPLTVHAASSVCTSVQTNVQTGTTRAVRRVVGWGGARDAAAAAAAGGAAGGGSWLDGPVDIQPGELDGGGPAPGALAVCGCACVHGCVCCVVCCVCGWGMAVAVHSQASTQVGLRLFH